MCLSGLVLDMSRSVLSLLKVNTLYVKLLLEFVLWLCVKQCTTMAFGQVNWGVKVCLGVCVCVSQKNSHILQSIRVHREVFCDLCVTTWRKFRKNISVFLLSHRDPGYIGFVNLVVTPKKGELYTEFIIPIDRTNVVVKVQVAIINRTWWHLVHTLSLPWYDAYLKWK